MTGYTNPYGDKRTVLKDSYPLNDNCHEITIKEEELATLTRYLVADTLKELEQEVKSMLRIHPDDAPYNYGIGDCLSLIRAKLKGGEDGAK